MQLSRDIAGVVRAFKHSLGHKSPPCRFWSCCRHLRRDVQWQQSADQTCPGLFQRGPTECSGSTPSVPLIPPTALERVPKFYQEAIMWKHGKHPNIIPFWGVTVTPLQFVSGWTSNGNITEYIKKHPGTDRLHLVCFPRAPEAGYSPLPSDSYTMLPKV